MRRALEVLLLLAAALPAEAQGVHTFHVDTFAFESGVKLPDATIVYATYGHLHGARFPAVTIRDNVRAVHELLVDSLHLTHLAAIVGFSMGAQQAFQWAVSY